MKKILLILTLFLTFNTSKAQWSEFSTYFPESLFDVSFTDPFNGFAVGQQGVILRTTDGAVTWEEVLRVPGVWFNSVDNFSIGSVIAAGTYSTVYFSNDNGATWLSMPVPDPDIHLRSIKIAWGLAWAVGYNGAFYRSPAPGVWNPAITQIPWTMHSIDFSSDFPADGRAIIAATDGRLYRTTNHGTNWLFVNIQQTMGVWDYLNSVKFLTNDFAIVVGNNGRIIRTTNSGLSWTNIAHGLTTEHLRDVDAVHDGFNFILVAVGDNGTILRSGDGGLTWVTQTMAPPTTRHLYGVSLPFFTKGYIVGEVGTYAEAAAFLNDNLNVGITNNGNVTPTQFSLSQNYPNPFNPGTKINFSIPKASNVKLTVFDMSGRKISELVNQRMEAGSYTYTFEGVNLTSGTYFYKLETEGFSSTKKMLFIK